MPVRTNREPAGVGVVSLDDVARDARRGVLSSELKPATFHCSLCGNASPYNEEHRCQFSTRRQRRRVEEGLRRQRETLEALRDAQASKVCPSCGHVSHSGAGHTCLPKNNADTAVAAWQRAGLLSAVQQAVQGSGYSLTKD